MIRIFYDTEFLEDGKTIDLISIGMVCEDGAEYYAVVNDKQTITRAVAHPWLRENVIPSLPVSLGGEHGWAWNTSHAHWGNVKSRAEIANDVQNFILAGSTPELWADYCAYDHVVLCQLWGRMIDLPEGVPMWTNDLRQVVTKAGNPELPELPGVTTHNALSDAREVAFRFRWLTENYERVDDGD